MTALIPAAALADAGVLLVGHGTRNAKGQAEFFTLAELVRKQLDIPLAPAFLELAQPTIDDGVGELVHAGARRLVVAPLLLFAAAHAKDDVPAAVRAALAACGAPDMPVIQARHFGCHKLIVELAWRRLSAAVASAKEQNITADDTILVLVGRGSRDQSATDEMHHFAALVGEKARLPHVRVGFLAMAEPRITDVLTNVARSSARRIVVQPHLLFYGELSQQLEKIVTTHSTLRPDQEWLLAGHLAEDLLEGGVKAKLLPQAVVHLVRQAIPRQGNDQ